MFCNLFDCFCIGYKAKAKEKSTQSPTDLNINSNSTSELPDNIQTPTSQRSPSGKIKTESQGNLSTSVTKQEPTSTNPPLNPENAKTSTVLPTNLQTSTTKSMKLPVEEHFVLNSEGKWVLPENSTTTTESSKFPEEEHFVLDSEGNWVSPATIDESEMHVLHQSTSTTSRNNEGLKEI